MGSGDESSGEQEKVPGLSDWMAEALRVVSAPDAFLQKDQDHGSIALPCFSFNKRGALVKTMSRKNSQACSGNAYTTSATWRIPAHYFSECRLSGYCTRPLAAGVASCGIRKHTWQLVAGTIYLASSLIAASSSDHKFLHAHGIILVMRSCKSICLD